jgi:NAD(P)-dependent dehydrogenase (short-subunit alcohol dehydrogenase family)
MAERNVLIVGASRGLGLALAAEYLDRGARVVATVRGEPPAALQQLESGADGRLKTEVVDVTGREGLKQLRKRLDERRFDVVFVNAGICTDIDRTAAEIPPDNFVRMMLTNVLGAMQTVEILYDLLTQTGTVAIMSSGLGSVSENSTGAWGTYAATKAALNMMMRGFASRHEGDGHAMVLMAPGWVRTEMGGAEASLGIEDSIPRVVDTVAAQSGRAGLRYLDYRGRTVGW